MEKSIICALMALGCAAQGWADISNYQPAVMPVDATKVACWIGEGDSEAILAVRWNEKIAERAYNHSAITVYANCKAMDNMVMGVRFNAADGLTARQIINKAVEGNPRFRSSGEGNYGYEMAGRGVELGSYDHNCSNTQTDTWKIFTAPSGQYEPTVDNGAAISDGEVIYLDYSAADVTEATPFENIFYIPALDEVGVWLPENYVFHIYDGMPYLPMYVSTGEGGAVNNYSFSHEDLDADAPSPLGIAYYYVSLSEARNGNTRAQLASSYQSGFTGRVKMTVTATINNQDYTASGIVDVREPVRPVTGFDFETALGDVVIEGYPNVYGFTPSTYTVVPSDATYTAYTWTSSDPEVATVNTKGVVSAAGKQGTTTISITPDGQPDLAVSYEATLKLNQLIESIKYGDGDSKIIHGTYLDIFCLEDAVIIPENADYKKLSYTVEEGKSDIASVYASTGDLINYKPGSIDVTISAKDGSGVSETYTFVFDEPDRTPSDDEYQDGFFWLNEDWFTHRSSSINYFRNDGEIIYRAYETQNPYQAFGATAQYGMIFGGRLYIVSKQAKDAGDPRPGGGRLVVADARTLKKIAAFETLAGDGRACVGVTPEKVYIGTSDGLQVLNVDPVGSDFSLGDVIKLSDEDGGLYNNQIGNMVEANGYVFAVMQNKGLVIIDGRTDRFVKCIDDTKAAAVVRAMDGDVYFAAATNLYRIDPNTLDADEPMTMPVSVTASWGAWRSTLMFASPTENVVFFAKSSTGFSPGMAALYKYIPGEAMPTEPLFTPTYPLTKTNKKTAGYAAAGYDFRTNEIMAMACVGAGSIARYNWLCKWDATTGEAKDPIPLKDYYWFPAMPIYPDKHEPVINLDKVNLPSDGASVDIDLHEVVSDLDTPFAHLTISHELTPVVEDEIALMSDDDTPAVSVERNGDILTLTRNSAGEHTLTLTAVSNGKRVTKNVAVGNDIETGIDGTAVALARIENAGRTVTCRNLDGQILTMYDMSGRAIKRISVQGNVFTFSVSVVGGVYILRADNGYTAKISIR